MNLPDISVLDADSKSFAFQGVSPNALHQDSDNISYERNPEYPQNYLRHIQSAEADIILLNCHLSLLRNLDRENILIVYPNLDLLPEYLIRYESRGDGSFVSHMASEAEGMIRYIEASGYDLYRIDSANTYLSDLFERRDFKMKVITKQELTQQLKRAMDLGVIRDELHTDSPSKLIFDASFALGETPRGLKNPEAWANAVLDGQYEMDIDDLYRACEKREADLEQEQALLKARGGLSREALADKIMQGIVNGALGICYAEIAPYSHGYEVTFGGSGALGSTREFANRWECYNCRFFDIPEMIVDKIERGIQSGRVFGASTQPLDIHAMLAAIEETEKNKIQGFIPAKDTDFERSQYPYRRGSVASVMDVHVGKGLDGIVQHHYSGDYSSMTPVRQNTLVETLVCMKGFCLDCLDRLEIGPDGRQAVVDYLKKHGTDISTPEKLQGWIRKHPEHCGKEVNRDAPFVKIPSNVSVFHAENWEPFAYYPRGLQWWSNADGDLYQPSGNPIDLEKAPEELQSAVSRLDPFSRDQIINLAETEQGFGLAFSFCYDESLGEGKLSMEQIYNALIQDATVIAQEDLFRNAEIFALESPPEDNAHTLIVFVPASISQEDFDRAADKLDKLTYQSVQEMASSKKPTLDSRIHAARSGGTDSPESNAPGREPER